MCRRNLYLILLALAASPSLCRAASPPLGNATLVCPPIPNSAPGPYVPDRKTAEAIYRAIAANAAFDLLKKYPVIIVEDHGMFWRVGQKRTKEPPEPPQKEDPNSFPSVVINAGGGQMSMSIDKCNGAISNLWLNR